MKRIATYIAVACVALMAHAQTDSIVPSVPLTYPYLTPISAMEDLNEDIMALRFSKADASAKKLIQTAKRKRQSTEEYDKVVDICHKGENGLRGVDRVLIVDSVVVDKKAFLNAYPLSADLGSLSLSEKGDIVQYQTQLNGMVIAPQPQAEGLTRYYLEDGTLTEGESIEGLGIEGDINYPFLMPDGQTFYFAARCEDGYGNYDLYATRYDSDSKRFYQAENMGLPYNSYANDYMLVIDESANLGWFASDRYQPDGKVCIYTFVPNESRQTIDYETTDLNELRALASLQSITALPLTDEQKEAKAEASRRLAKVKGQRSKVNRVRDFEFVLNDARTCYTLNDFTSNEARKQCSDWLQKSKNLTTLYEQLQQMRETSPTAKQQILNLETRIKELQAEVHALEKQIRMLELKK
ncbi:MAG: hypothetical protein J6T38_10000 [Bacteroidaceae bacterium]|nr:hypothetical protein [Bacteroidaceae bacterium]